MFLFKKTHVLRGPDDDKGSGGGGTAVVDRGDDFVPTDGDGDDGSAAAVVVDKTVTKTDAELLAEAPKKTEETDPLKAAKLELTEEEKAAAAALVEAEKGKTKDTRIPAARHKEILDKERAKREGVEAELAKYKQGTQIAELGAVITETEKTLVALESTYAKQITDGEHEKAASTMTQIRRTERAINDKTAEVREQAAVARAVEATRYDTTVDRLEVLYPALNPTHEDFDKGKTGEVLELKEMYQAKGYTPSAALQKAVGLIMPPETKKQEAALTTEARVDAAAVEAARKAAAVEKTTEAILKTPASTKAVGLDSDKSGGGAITGKDVMKMSHKDFSALNEETLSRLRGDLV